MSIEAPTNPHASRIRESLLALRAKQHRVIWWADPEAQFTELVDELQLEDLTLLRRSQVPALALKRQLELIEPGQAFVIYEDEQAPEPTRDWLLDIRRYAAPFSADASAMLVQDLGLRHQQMSEHLKLRARFLGSKARLERLQRWVTQDDLEAELDLKMLAVAVRADQADTFSLFSTLFASVSDLDPAESVNEAKAWQAIVKLDLEAPLWALAAKTFGFRSDTPSLLNLLLQLFVSDLGAALQTDLPDRFKSMQLPPRMTAAATMFLAQWRDSSLRQTAYDRVSARMATELRINEDFDSVPLKRLAACNTFVVLEKQIAGRLREALADGGGAALADEIRQVVTARRDGYWANGRLPDSEQVPRSTWNAFYRAIEAAQAFFTECDLASACMSFASAQDCVTAYTRTLYRVDQLYRRYHEAGSVVASRDPATLEALTRRIEDQYLNRFLQPLAQRWDDFVRAGLLLDWKVEGLPSQQHFFEQKVRGYLGEGEDRRIFVVISDALRYEVAQELAEQINGRNRFAAELSAQLGVLPSYTGLGMASLLPHKSMAYRESETVYVDGQSSDGIEQRRKILAAHRGIAFTYDEFIALNKQDGRDAVRDASVVYVFHDCIDKIGDKLPTELGTFDACRDAINELDGLVSRIINNLNGNHVVITADHGFLFQRSALGELDKNKLDLKPAGTVKSKKRYLFGRNLGEVPQAFSGYIRDTAGVEDDMMFWVPKGVNRFHFVGGARFVHGGAALQEIVVPVLTVKHQRGEKAKAIEVRKTSVSVIGGPFRITTPQYPFQLLQTEPVTERIRPVIARVTLVDDADKPVSNTETLTFDSAAADSSQSRRKVMLSLTSDRIASNKPYYLLITDAETTMELCRIVVRIDLAFGNDFDF